MTNAVTNAVTTAVKPLRYGQLDDGIVVAGVLAIARRDGLSRLTMRAVAMEVGMSPASLYYHVANKEKLLDLVADSVLGSVVIPRAGLAWDEQLKQLFSRGRAALLPIEGIAGVLQSRPLSGSGRVLDDASMRILHSAGFEPRAARAATMLLSTFLLGAVALDQALAASGLRGSSHFNAGLETIMVGLRVGR